MSGCSQAATGCVHALYSESDRSTDRNRMATSAPARSLSRVHFQTLPRTPPALGEMPRHPAALAVSTSKVPAADSTPMLRDESLRLLDGVLDVMGKDWLRIHLHVHSRQCTMPGRTKCGPRTTAATPIVRALFAQARHPARCNQLRLRWPLIIKLGLTTKRCKTMPAYSLHFLEGITMSSVASLPLVDAASVEHGLRQFLDRDDMLRLRFRVVNS